MTTTHADVAGRRGGSSTGWVLTLLIMLILLGLYFLPAPGEKSGASLPATEKLTPARPCPTCHGYKQVKCTGCLARGVIFEEKRAPCPKCDGKGTIASFTGSGEAIMCTQCARKGYVIASVQTVCEKCKGTTRIPCTTCGGTGLAPVAPPQPASAAGEKVSAPRFHVTDWLGVTSIDERGVDHGPQNMLGWTFLKARGIARTYLTPSPAPTNAPTASPARTTS